MDMLTSFDNDNRPSIKDLQSVEQVSNSINHGFVCRESKRICRKLFLC